MSNNDRPTEAARTLVPVPSSALHLRSSANGRHPISQPQQGITPKFALHVLRHWWMIATPAGLLLAGIAVGIVWWTFEPEYEATTWLRIKSQQPFLAFAPGQAERGAGDLFVQTQVEMIRSPLVLAPVTGQPEAAKVPELQEEDDPTGWLAKNIKVSSVGKSELFKISLVCANAKDSAWLVNAVAHEYLLLLGQDEAERTQTVISTLREEKSSRESEVKRLRESLRELTRQITGEDPFSPLPTTNPNLAHPLADLNSRLITTEVEQTVLAANIKAREKQLADRQAEELADVQAENSTDTRAEDPYASIEAGLIEEALEQDQEIRRLQQQITLSQAVLDDRESKLTVEKAKEDRGCIELRDAISEDEELLDNRRAVVRKRIEARLAASPTGQFESPTARLEEELDAMKFKLEGLKITKELLQERYESKLGEAENVSGDTLELYFLRDELNKAEGVFAVLAERIERLTTEQRAPNQVKLLRTADAAVVPVEEAPYTNMALASLLFFVPFGLAGAWEYLIRRVSNMQQLEESANLTVIGEVARLPVQARVGRNGSKTRMDLGLTVFEESIDGLRTHLMLSEELLGMKVLAVTSAAADEGKTSVAAQLAVNMAWVSGKRTLLIDGDMRSPDIHNVFDIPQEPGLAEILTGDCSVEDAIVRNEKNYTDVLPAGKARTNPHRLLGNGALEPFMEEVRSKYDHIIIDTPPILAASEALVLARMADRSLMCAMKDSSRIDQIKKAHERLVLAGGQPIGIVLNGVPTSHYLHRYGVYAYSRD